MTTRKTNLDERQELILLDIEHKACWLAFWGLLVAILAQEVIYGGELRYVAGEWIVFMLLCVYMLHGCMKNGIWDRRLQPDNKTNALASLGAGAVVGVVCFLIVMRRADNLKIAGCAGVFAGIFTAVLCFAALSISAARYRKKLQEAEKEPEE